jgi:hypothetical protein
MNILILMKLPDSYCYLNSIKPHLLLWKPLLLTEKLVELSSSNERHHEVKPVLILEDIVHGD